jgi:hypothetical protein
MYHFSPLCKLPRGFLDPASASRIHLLIRNRLQVQPVEVCLPEQTARRSRDGRVKLRGREIRMEKGECFAKEDLSAAEAASREDARLPRAHEDERRPQGAGGAPQEGTSSAHARVVRGAWIFLAPRDWCAKASSMPYTAPGSAGRVPTSLFFSA